MRAWILFPKPRNELRRQPRGRMHGQINRDEPGSANRRLIQGLPGKIERYDPMAAFAQPRRRRRQPEGLPPQLVGRNENDVHGHTSIACAALGFNFGYDGRLRITAKGLSGWPLTRAILFRTRDKLNVGAQTSIFTALSSLKSRRRDLAKLPFSLRILLENLLRCEDGRFVHAEDIRALANWRPVLRKRDRIHACAVLLQDFTGVPAIVDLATMREAVQRMGGNPKRINPLFPAELVIDHSVQVDNFGNVNAFGLNAELEFQRNVERYAFPALGGRRVSEFQSRSTRHGICHQVNLEYLARSSCAMPYGNRLRPIPIR